MTNFYSPETCQQLQQLGCVASSGEIWYGNGYEPHVMWETGRPDNFTLEAIEQYKNKQWDEHFFPAYSNADFLASPEAKENCIKLWGETPYWFFEHKLAPNKSYNGFSEIKDWSLSRWGGKSFWQYQSYLLLDIILSGGDGESFIKEALGNK